jgi:S-adenosylmethionine:tRNA ribosyltransferase-isomerase
VGEKWRELYEYALNNDYRFLSYGDSSVLIP